MIKIKDKSYYINADTKKDSVKTFLKNKVNPWHVVSESNRVTNDLNKTPIKGLYIYLNN